MQQSRHEWMDLLRGAAVLLVVAHHVTAIPRLYGYEFPGWSSLTSDLFAPYRIPLLLFLSGMLLRRSLDKGLPQYFWGKARNIVWPLLVWTAIYIIGGGPIPEPATALTWLSLGHLWFLLALVGAYLVGPVTKLVPPWLVAAGFLLVSAAVSGVAVERFIYLEAFFFVGATAGSRVVRWQRGPATVPLLLGLVAVGYAVLSLVRGAPTSTSMGGFVLSLAGIGFLVWAAPRLSGRWAAPVRTVGRHAIVFYLSHFMVILWVMFALRKLEADAPWVLAVVGGAAAVLVGAWLARHQYRQPWALLFAAPLPAAIPGAPSTARGRRGRQPDPADRG